MIRWVKLALALCMVGLLLGYLSKHWSELAILMHIRLGSVVALYVLLGVTTFTSTLAALPLLRALNVRVDAWDLLVLQNATYLFNYLPMKMGTAFRAEYLKRRYDLSYARFSVLFLSTAVLMSASCAAVGLPALILTYGLTTVSARLLGLAFTGLAAGALTLLLAPLPVPAGDGKLSKILRAFLQGRACQPA